MAEEVGKTRGLRKVRHRAGSVDRKVGVFGARCRTRTSVAWVQSAPCTCEVAGAGAYACEEG